MTTHFRTLLLLGFTALGASASGCILETTSSNSGCSEERYFQVYWSVSDALGQFTCSQAPASHVELITNNGSYVVGKECRVTNYMGLIYDFAGSTLDGIPTGTYVVTANLVSDSTGAILSAAPGAGAAYPMPSCSHSEAAYPFDI